MTAQLRKNAGYVRIEFYHPRWTRKEITTQTIPAKLTLAKGKAVD